jgi:hypothetical protein
MIASGPLAAALEALKGEIETGNEANSSAHHHTQTAERDSHTNNDVITHRFRMSETHIQEGEIQQIKSTVDNDKIETEDVKSSNKKCSCFSFLRICRKKPT